MPLKISFVIFAITLAGCTRPIAVSVGDVDLTGNVAAGIVGGNFEATNETEELTCTGKIPTYVTDEGGVFEPLACNDGRTTELEYTLHDGGRLKGIYQEGIGKFNDGTLVKVRPGQVKKQ